MGVEYTHGLDVADLAWRPTRARADAITAVLRAWGSQRRR
jgi:hypothetical protein